MRSPGERGATEEEETPPPTSSQTDEHQSQSPPQVTGQTALNSMLVRRVELAKEPLSASPKRRLSRSPPRASRWTESPLTLRRRRVSPPADARRSSDFRVRRSPPAKFRRRESSSTEFRRRERRRESPHPEFRLRGSSPTEFHLHKSPPMEFHRLESPPAQFRRHVSPLIEFHRRGSPLVEFERRRLPPLSEFRRRGSPPLLDLQPHQDHGYVMHAGSISPPRRPHWSSEPGPPHHALHGSRGRGRGDRRFRNHDTLSPHHIRGGSGTKGQKSHSTWGPPHYELRNDPNLSPREGDWICQNPICGNLNFARRNHCNICKKHRFSFEPHHHYVPSSPPMHRTPPVHILVPREPIRYRTPPQYFHDNLIEHRGHDEFLRGKRSISPLRGGRFERGLRERSRSPVKFRGRGRRRGTFGNVRGREREGDM